MNLTQWVDHNLTDKNSIHSYFQVYDPLLAPLRDAAKNVLEVGVERGGSILLWHEAFPNAIIHGVDIRKGIPSPLQDLDRMILYMNQDAYDLGFVEKLASKKYDLIVDDGPHTLESMIFFVQHYVPLLSDIGVLVVEDIPELDWTQILQSHISQEYSAEVHDLRKTKDRFDDILLVVKRRANV